MVSIVKSQSYDVRGMLTIWRLAKAYAKILNFMTNLYLFLAVSPYFIHY
jgi:hypothetical protein